MADSTGNANLVDGHPTVGNSSGPNISQDAALHAPMPPITPPAGPLLPQTIPVTLYNPDGSPKQS